MSDQVPPAPRKFPAPWTVSEIPGGFRVLDAAGVTVAWVYARDDLAAKSNGRAWLTTAEARRIALWIARSPDLAPHDRRSR
ncbi:MAG TPA: hypothetical protein PK264_18865 [Hyphomicrobiaceae bacterium]|nr:hypothetical protein [Hyphomicrobiaceae bacterium]